jgi:hypothetical protein
MIDSSCPWTGLDQGFGIARACGKLGCSRRSIFRKKRIPALVQGVPRRASKRRFVEPIQRDLPCPVPLRKIFLFPGTPNQFYKSLHPVPPRGAYHDRHGRRDGMRWTRQHRRARRSQGRCKPVSDRAARRRTMLQWTAKPCGPGTRCWC